MKLQISAISASLATAAILAWPGTASAVKDLVVDVNCASGDGIARALDRPNVLDRRMVIVVNGTCTENVVIERDDVVLKGGGAGGGVSAADAARPTILVNGARRVTMQSLTVAGGRHAVQVSATGAATLRNCTIRNAVVNGVHVDDGAAASIDACTIEGNGNSGVVAVRAGATMMNSAARGNGLYGVVASRGGSVLLGNLDAAGNVCCGNTIENNAFDGVLAADAASAHLYGNTIQGNGATTGRNGVLAVRASSILLRGGNVVRQNGSATLGSGVFVRASVLNTGQGDTPVIPQTNDISGNTFGVQGASNSMIELRGGVSITGSRFTGVVADTGTTVRMEGGAISGNGAHGIFSQRDSSVEFFGAPAVVTGNTAYGLYCNDPETSYTGNVSQISGNTLGNVSPSCTGY